MAIDPVERLNLALSAGAVAASFALGSPLFAASLAVGALLETLNFRTLRRSAKALFAGQLVGGSGWSMIYAVRFTLLAIGMGVALYVGAHPVGLVIGLSLIVPAVVIEAWRSRPLVPAEPAPSLPPDDPSWDRWNPWLARERDIDEEDEEEGW